MKCLVVGGWLLAVGGWCWTAGAVELAVPGEGWRKVRLVYEARVTDDATYEAHPEYEAMPRLAKLHACRVKPLPDQPRTFAAIGNFRHFVWSADWRKYVREMWLPPGVEKLEVGFGKKSPVESRGWRVEEVRDGRTEVNGDFGLGADNYSGFSGNDRTGRIERGDGGRGLLNDCPDGSTGSEPFPLEPGVEYRLIYEWNNFFSKSPRMRMQMRFFDKDGKGVDAAAFSWHAGPPRGWGRKGTVNPDWIVSTNTFAVKEGVVAGAVTFYEGLVKSYRIEKTAK